MWEAIEGVFVFLVYPCWALLLELCPTHVALLYFWVHLHILYKSREYLIPFTHTMVSGTYINPSSAFKCPTSPWTSFTLEQLKVHFVINILAPHEEVTAHVCWKMLLQPVWQPGRSCRRVTSIGHGSVKKEQPWEHNSLFINHPSRWTNATASVFLESHIHSIQRVLPIP